MHGKLDIGATGVHPDCTDTGNGPIPHLLIFAVRQCHGGGHRDRITGVHTHGVNILDSTYNNHVVGMIADHFQLELFPPQQRLLNQNFRDGALTQAILRQLLIFFMVIGHGTAAAAQGKCRPDNHREIRRRDQLFCGIQ